MKLMTVGEGEDVREMHTEERVFAINISKFLATKSVGGTEPLRRRNN